MSFGLENVEFIGKTIEMIEKYGKWKFIQAVLVLSIGLYLAYSITNMGDIVRDVVNDEVPAVIKGEAEKSKIMHDNALQIRRNIKSDIDNLLNKTLADTGADRIFVLEMHNGTNNPSGLPFLYVEMTYCAVSPNTLHVDDDYINLNLSRFNFPMYLENNVYWSGTVEELKELDEKLAYRIASNDVKYFAIMTIHGIDCELGYFGISYCRDFTPEDEKILINKLGSASQKLASLLDYNKLDMTALMVE